MGGNYAESPLAKWPGVLQDGVYILVNPRRQWAFEPLASMWTPDENNLYSLQQEDTSSDSSEEEDGNSGGSEPIQPQATRCGNRSIRPIQSQATRCSNRIIGKKPPRLYPPQQQASRLSKEALAQLYRRVQHCKDRLFLVAYKPDDLGVTDWRLAQVKWDECNLVQARQFGVYVV